MGSIGGGQWVGDTLGVGRFAGLGINLPELCFRAPGGHAAALFEPALWTIAALLVHPQIGSFLAELAGPTAMLDSADAGASHCDSARPSALSVSMLPAPGGVLLVTCPGARSTIPPSEAECTACNLCERICTLASSCCT